MLGSYGNTSSFSFGYNLYADKWLGTNIVNSSVSSCIKECHSLALN